MDNIELHIIYENQTLRELYKSCMDTLCKSCTVRKSTACYRTESYMCCMRTVCSELHTLYMSYALYASCTLYSRAAQYRQELPTTYELHAV